MPVILPYKSSNILRNLKNNAYFCAKRMTKKAKNSRFGLLF